MEEKSSIKSSFIYQQGYDDGFREGMNKAIEYFREEMLNPRPIQISVSKNEFEEIYKGTFNVLGGLNEKLEK